MRVAIGHTSAVARHAIEAALAKLPQCELAWAASDLSSTLQKASDAPPDLLLLEARSGIPSSAEVTRKLQGICSVLLIQGDSSGSISLVYDGMAAGALDVAPCPGTDSSGRPIDDGALLAKLKSLRSVVVPMSPVRTSKSGNTRVVLIGSSTGGPQALQTILSRLPHELNVAYVVAQHLDVEFSAGLASLLNRETKLTVRVALQDSVPEAHTVLIAGTNDHLVLTARRRLIYSPNPKEAPYRPSADALFLSFAAHWSETGVAVLLTGMGKDGGQGMLKLFRAGWHTIAQDAATSVVFGMPRAAIELGAAKEVLPVLGIADAIVRACKAPARPMTRAV